MITHQRLATVVLLARRFLFATRGRPFARGLLALAVTSVALAAFALAVVSGVFLGFRQHLEQKLLGFQPHLTIASVRDIAAVTTRLAAWQPTSIAREFIALQPIIVGEGVIQVVGREGYADVGVRIQGVDPTLIEALSGADWFFAPTHLRSGEGSRTAQALAVEAPSGIGGALLGMEIVSILGIDPAMDERVRLIAPLGMIDPTGNLQPSLRTFDVTGFFRTGLYQQDSRLVFVAREEAARVLGEQAQPQWAIYLRDGNAASHVAHELRGVLGDTAKVVTWREQNQKLFSALALERVIMTVLLLLTVAIAGISVLGVVMTHVRARQRDLAILLTLGARRRHVQHLVLALGGWIGGLGAVVGLSCAGALALWLNRHPISLPATFYVETLPLTLSPSIGSGVAVVVVAMTIGAAWYPAWIAARVPPVEALRSE